MDNLADLQYLSEIAQQIYNRAKLEKDACDLNKHDKKCSSCLTTQLGGIFCVSCGSNQLFTK